MITNKIVLRKKYKYKSFCDILDIEVKKGTCSKNAQLKYLKQYLDILKEKTLYSVLAIYAEPIPKIDGRKVKGENENRKGHSGTSEGSRNNNNPYGKYIDPILTNYFNKSESKTIFTTTNMLAQEIGLVNRNYSYVTSNKKRYYQYSWNEVNGNSNYTCMWDTMGAIKGVLRGTIRSSLERLTNSNLITYQESYMFSYNYKVRIATNSEIETIEKYEKQVLEKLETTKKTMQFNDKLRDKYYSEVERLVKEKIKYIDKMFIGYKIRVIVDEGKLLSENELNEHIKDLNYVFRQRINESVIRRNKKEIKEHCTWMGQMKPNIEKWIKDRINSNYIYYAEYIIETLIKLDYKYIVPKIKKEITKEDIENGIVSWMDLPDYNGNVANKIKIDDIDLPY